MANIGVFSIIESWPSGKILMVKHSYGTQGLSLPGGGLDIGETPESTIAREVKEETGLEGLIFDYCGLFFIRTRAEGVFLFQAATMSEEDLSPINPKEISEIIWVSPRELPEGTYPSQRALVKRWLDNDCTRPGLPWSLL